MDSNINKNQAQAVLSANLVDCDAPAQTSCLASSDITLKTISVKQWDELATLFDDIIPEQTGVFNAAHWGQDKIECVEIQQQHKTIGGAVLIVRKIPLSTTGLAILKWGPIWCLKNSNPDESRYRLIVQALMAEYCEKRNMHLTIMPQAIPNANEKTSKVLGELGFKTGSTLAAPDRYIVNTDQSPDELMSSLNQKWRYNMRKAHKNDFEISFADNQHGLEVFTDLYAKMIERKQFLDASAIGSLKDIINNGIETIKPRIILVHHQGKPTAAGVISMIGNMAVYMFGATDERALTLKAGYAMHWWLAEHLCNQPQIKWYDLGGNDLDAGLHQFKKGFVGKTGHILQTPPRYHYANSPIVNLVGNTIFHLRDYRAAALRKLHGLK